MEEENIKICSSVLAEHTDLLDSVLRMYIEDINPLIVRYEIGQGEFPTEVLNEIRAIYGHLVRATMAETPDQVVGNINKMRSHSKRALLDCFKCNALMCADNYKGFMSKYKDIDLTYLEDGKFLREVDSLYDRAVESLQKAKISETSNIPEDELFSSYLEAYQQFEFLDERIKSMEKSAEYLAHKASKRDKGARISLLVGVAGFLLGLQDLLLESSLYNNCPLYYILFMNK